MVETNRRNRTDNVEEAKETSADSGPRVPTESPEIPQATTDDIIAAAQDRMPDWSEDWRVITRLQYRTLDAIRETVRDGIAEVVGQLQYWRVKDGIVQYAVDDVGTWIDDGISDAIAADPITDDWTEDEITDFATTLLYCALQAFSTATPSSEWDLVIRYVGPTAVVR